jgi:ribosomal protein S27AE
MGDFRHNLSPVEVKKFLKTIAELAEDLLIRFCFKVPARCPQCGHPELCRSAAISLYSNSFDKFTHEITVCLNCGYKHLTALLTCERL